MPVGRNTEVTCNSYTVIIKQIASLLTHKPTHRLAMTDLFVFRHCEVSKG